jgi:fumarate reductase subunit C
MLNLHLYMLQRITALIMAPLVIGHIAVMIYAIQGGLSAAEILGRTQGSVGWALFYGLFVLAAAIHGAIGVRVIVHEVAGLKGPALSLITWGLCAGLIVLGGMAVWGVTFGVGA